ncbi:MAG TPA: alpha-2-macroglobulin family protein, partial [Labilithrix sp.]|nr:alpha-2-macroglobulin family protein [Labilithrix sp.]
YRVTIGKALADVHGQTLAEDASFVVDVGSAEPVLFGAERDMIVLEPAAPRAYTLYSINQAHLRVRLYAVKPEDWPTFTRYARDWEGKVAAPGKLVFDKVVDPQAAPDELVATAVGLEPALKEGVGQAMLVVETAGQAGARDRERGFRTWIQATQLGIDGYIEPDRVTGFVTRLADGAAEANVEIGVLGAASARSDARGIATIPLGDKGGPLLYARKGGDVVIAPAGSWGDATIQRMVRPDSVRWLVFDDRGMYRPGEEVHLKGWIRRAVQKRGGDLGLLGNLRSVAFVATDPRGAQIAKGEATLDGQGSFALSFMLPREGNLGSVRIALALDTKEVTETTWSHTVKVAEFRRPEFEVTARASEGPHLVGKHAVATLSAAYYAGGGLGAAKVDWRVTRSPASFTPPNRGDYHFGPRSEEGRDTFGDDEDDEPSPGGGQAVETWSALTNAQGIHRLRVDFDPRDPPHPMSLHLAASVEDKNHQQWSADTRMLVHPASEYVGLRARRAFLQPGDDAALAIVVTDLDGKAVPGRRVALRASRLEWEQKGAEYVETEVDLETLEVTSRADGTAEASFKTREAGRLLVRALVVDAEGRRNETTTLLWVAGSLGPRDRSVKGSGLVVVTDKVDYRAGDEAEVLVVSPFVPAEGVLTVRRQGIVHLERFTLKSNAQTLKIKLDDGLVPNATVQVDLVGATLRADEQGAADASLPKVPAYGSKGVAIRVAPTSRVLEVKATPRSTKLEPGGATQIDVDVKDAQGHGLANARVAVIVADEAVLALSRKKTPDPIAAFYGARALDVRSLGMRDRVVMMRDASRLASTGDRDADGILDSADRCPNEPENFNGLQDQDGCPDRGRVVVESNNLIILQPGAASVATPIVVRKNFSPLAVFAPSVGTDANGHAVVPVKLPDNLTRYRIMAVASAGEKSFGATESTLVARLPLMVRPSAPRFLNFGDRFELPVLLQNQTDAPLTVDVVLRATNAALAGPAGKRVEVPANDRVEVRFAAAAAKPGRARFQIGATSGGLADASQVELPVYTPATAEAFATYGELDRGAIAQAVARPKNVLPGYGGLEVTTSSTALQALTDAVLYLVRYPYECAEQIASRVLAVTALRDVLGAFEITGAPAPAAMLASTKADLDRLRKEQQADGGWSFWAGGETWPYLTVHVAHALTRAKDKGIAVDASTFERARGYLQRIETLFTPAYGPEERRVITAYALYVRRRMGDADAPRARRLIAEAGGVDKLPLEAIGWIWPTLSADRASAAEVEQIRRHLANRAEETASDAHFTTSYGDSSYLLLASDRRADGIVLESMIGDDPTATLIPKLAKGLLAHRTAGRWSSTQENAFVLLALARYFETYEKTTPDFVARVWLGDRFAGEHAFKGRTTERSNVGIPMSVVAASAPGELVLAKDGPGRLYYRIGMQYAPAGPPPPPADHGFTVLRRYEPIDAPDDLTHQQDAAGWFWRAKAGARIRVRVTMVTRSRRAHVALVDPLPAGFEPMNPELAVTGAIPQDPKAATSGHAWWQRTWYEHENLRDDRVEAFASLVWEGVHEYTYVARATTPGSFVAPAPRAEEMYTPETFGRGASDRIVVLP